MLMETPNFFVCVYAQDCIILDPPLFPEWEERGYKYKLKAIIVSIKITLLNNQDSWSVALKSRLSL